MYTMAFTFHVIFAGMWLSFFITNVIFIKKLQTGAIFHSSLLSIYLKITLIFEIIGVLGMLTTGIFMVLDNSFYGFFDMTANHWLATKQIIFVVILFLISLSIFPNWKRLNEEINNGNEIISENKALKKIIKSITIVNILVLFNFLLAATHTFYS